MSTKEEFPFLEHLVDNIATFARIEMLKTETKNSLVELMRVKSNSEEEFKWRTSKIKDSDLIDRDVDFAGVHPEVRRVVENPRYRPWLKAGQLAEVYIDQKKRQTLEKYVVPHVKKPIMKIQHSTKNDIVKKGVQIAYELFRMKLGL